MTFRFWGVGVHFLDGKSWGLGWPGSPCRLTVLGVGLELVLIVCVLYGWLVGGSRHGFLSEEGEVVLEDVGGWWRWWGWWLLKNIELVEGIMGDLDENG